MQSILTRDTVGSVEDDPSSYITYSNIYAEYDTHIAGCGDDSDEQLRED